VLFKSSCVTFNQRYARRINRDQLLDPSVRSKLQQTSRYAKVAFSFRSPAALRLHGGDRVMEVCSQMRITGI
jgi:hypothetical protein